MDKAREERGKEGGRMGGKGVGAQVSLIHGGRGRLTNGMLSPLKVSVSRTCVVNGHLAALRGPSRRA